MSEWLKGKNDISITFPKGTYYIGQQKNSPKTVVENIKNIFTIENASGITIIGNGAKIKYVDRLMYGAFEIGRKKKMTHNTAFSKAENAAYPGNCIKIFNSNNINISNLELDGNSAKMIIGGRYGDVGIQLWHRGFYIINSYDVRLKQVNIHHFGLIKLGHLGAQLALCRDCLSDIGRAINYLIQVTGERGIDAKKLRGLAVDILNLHRQCEAQSNDLTFVLDATLGLIGARQSKALNFMAVVTLLFAPATLISSIFGMNFQNWHFVSNPIGLLVAISSMALSALFVLFIAKYAKLF